MQKAVVKALPGCTDPVQIAIETSAGADFNCPSAMKFYNMSKKNGSYGFPNCKEMAEKMVAEID